MKSVSHDKLGQVLREQSHAFETPAFIYDQRIIHDALDRVQWLEELSGVKVRFSLKAFSLVGGLRPIAKRLGGLEASSLFEAELGRWVLGTRGAVHLTSPGLRPVDMERVDELCSHVAFNSLNQFETFRRMVPNPHVSVGLRVNPGLSFASDERYDPCVPTSKLGVPLEEAKAFCLDSAQFPFRGIHFHSNCESRSFEELRKTVSHLATSIPELLDGVEWVNTGGGYLVDEAEDVEALIRAAEQLRSFNVEVFMEPGEGLIRRCGYIVASVIDIVHRAGQSIAILDTTINHMPELFEYSVEPIVVGAVDGGKAGVEGYQYELVGCSCLAGDRIGRYHLPERLEIGSRIMFADAAAYTHVKAHMFNGINLPSVYAVSPAGVVEHRQTFKFTDYLSRCVG